MISFKQSEDELAFVEVARNFAINKIRPSARDTEKNREVSLEICGKLQELGFTSLELPESFGGLELPLVSQVQIQEALSYGDIATVQGLPGINEAASFIRLDSENPLFVSFRNTHQSGTWPTVSLLLNQLYSTIQNLKIEKREKGYQINGTCLPVKMGEKADYGILAGTDENGHEVLLWLKNSNQHLWKAEKEEYRLGLVASRCSRLHFNNCFVADGQILAKGETASRLVKKAITRIRVLEAAKEVGTMSAAVDYVTEYTASRKAFGKEIAKFQGVSFTVAQMALQTHAARNLVWLAAKNIDNNKPDGISSSISALNYTHRSIRFVTDSAVQLLGGHGYVQDHPVEKWMRDAQAQVNLFETEGDLLARNGEYILSGEERRTNDDILRTVSTPKSS